jgi:predicted Zn finger-like uncharacterized protein
MKVTCPNCDTKYNLPDEKIPGAGSNVRCSRCHHVFHVDKPAPPPQPPEEIVPEVAPESADDARPDTAAAEPAAHDQDIDDLFGDVEQAAPETAQAPSSPGSPGSIDEPATHDQDIDELFGPSGATPDEPRTQAPKDEIEDLFGGPAEPEAKLEKNKPIVFETEQKGLGKGGLGLGELAKTFAGDKGKPKARPSAKTKLAALIAAAVLGLAAVSAGTLYFLKIGPFAEKKPVETAAAPPPKTEEKKPEETSKNLALIGVRQYMVDNTKTGNLFVIEGKVKNNFTTPKEYIKIEASLFDDKGVTLATKQIVAGNTVSYFQLQSLGTEELETALNSQVGILTNNVNVRPGGEVPFMVIFYNPPESLQEFGVKVVDAKDPAPDAGTNTGAAPDTGTGKQ